MDRSYYRNTTYIIFVLYLALMLIFIIFGKCYIFETDDTVLRYILSNGESTTLIMSYPLSSIVSMFYNKLPNIDWYSILITFYMIIIGAVFSFVSKNFSTNNTKLFFTLIGMLFFIFMWQNITITSITLLLIIVSFPLLKDNYKLFWLIVIFAYLLRSDIVISTLPFLAIAFIYFSKEISWNFNKILILLFAIVTIFFINLSKYSDENYTDWLKYNSARVYFADLKGPDKKNLLTEDEKEIAYSWYPQDASLLSSNKIIKAKGSLTDAIIYNIKTIKLHRIISYFYHHKSAIILFFFTLLLFKYKTSLLHKFLITSYGFGFFVLLLIRNVDRVIFPLIFLWIIILIFEYAKLKNMKIINYMSILLILTLLLDLPFSNVPHEHKAQEVKNELINLLKRHPEKKIEFSYSFPLPIKDKLVLALLQNRLFDEKNWIENYVLPSGWLARHPLYYKMHQITAYGKKRIYSNYYEYLLNKNSVFIGSKSNFYKDKKVLKILEMYNEKFGNNICEHKIKIIDTSKNFYIAKLTCDISRGTSNEK